MNIDLRENQANIYIKDDDKTHTAKKTNNQSNTNIVTNIHGQPGLHFKYEGRTGHPSGGPEWI